MCTYQLTSYAMYKNFLVHLSPLGLDDLMTTISSTPLIDQPIKASRPMVLSTSVLMQNIPTRKCTKEWLDMYLTNTSISGIESYKEIQIIEDGRVIVHLNDKKGKSLVLLFM